MSVMTDQKKAMMDQTDLFGIDANGDKRKKCKLHESPLYDVDVFCEIFASEMAAGINMSHYRTTLALWSDQKSIKRNHSGWIATFRNVLIADKKKKKLVMLVDSEKKSMLDGVEISTSDFMDFMDDEM